MFMLNVLRVHVLFVNILVLQHYGVLWLLTHRLSMTFGCLFPVMANKSWRLDLAGIIWRRNVRAVL